MQRFKTVGQLEPIGRWLAVIMVLVIAIIGVSAILYLKAKKKTKLWFKPIGIYNLVGSSKLSIRLLKSDYMVWAAVASGFLIYWFAAYFLVSIVLLTQYNQAIQQAVGHGGIQYVWNPYKITSSGSIGGYEAIFKDDYDAIIARYPNDLNTQLNNIINKTYKLMPYLTSQTNFNYYIFNLQSSIYNGLNNQNGSTRLLSLPSFNLLPFWNLLSLGQNVEAYEVNSPYYLTNLYHGFTQEQFTVVRSSNAIVSDQKYIDQQTQLWVHSFVYSNVLLTPLCQSLGLIFPATLVLSRKKDYATIVAPWAFLGGIVTLFGGIASDHNIHISLQFIFYDQQMFYLYHSFIFITGLCWFVYSQRYSFVSMTSTYFYMAGYLIWIVIVANIFNIRYFTTAITPLDLSVSGSYGIVNNDLLKDTLIEYPGNTLLMFFVFATIITITIIVKNLIHYYFFKKNLHDVSDSYFNDIKQTYKFAKEHLKRIVIFK